MARMRFDDDCPGCRPAIMNMETGEPLPDTDPLMVAAMRVWGRTTRKEREVFHKVTCLNSKLPSDVRVFRGVVTKIQTEVGAGQPGSDYTPEDSAFFDINDVMKIVELNKAVAAAKTDVAAGLPGAEERLASLETQVAAAQQTATQRGKDAEIAGESSIPLEPRCDPGVGID